MKTIEPSIFKAPHAPYNTDPISRINPPTSPEFKARLYAAQHRPIYDLLPKQQDTSIENVTSYLFAFFGFLTLVLAISGFSYVNSKRNVFFDTENQAIKPVDVKGKVILDKDEVGLHIVAFPTLKNAITNTDRIILPNIYDGETELFPAGSTVGITCAYFVPSYPEVSQSNPPYYYVDIWKNERDTNFNYRLNEGQGVVYSVARVGNRLEWFLIRTNSF